MLQLEASNLDIIKVSKILAKFNINASTSNTGIILNDGEISEELINTLISNGVAINSVRNFIGETSASSFEDNSLSIETDINNSGFIIKDSSHKTKIPANCQEYDLLFPTVKRGEVYLCDFGEPYVGDEFGYLHPAVIVQNDIIENVNCQQTIVLPCSSSASCLTREYYDFYISNSHVFDKKTAIICNRIRNISKIRLRKFWGTLDEKTMEELEYRIHFVTGNKPLNLFLKSKSNKI